MSINYDKQNRKLDALNAEISRLKDQQAKLIEESTRLREVLDSTLHEIRRFSGELGTHAEKLSRDLQSYGVSTETVELAQTVFYTTGMISARLGFTDLELNPRAVSSQGTLRAGVYKKFEKARHLLGLKCKLRRIPIIFKGNSYLEIEALPAFELVPFVILDNAVKYSPPDHQVVVEFEESAGQFVRVTVRSFGPYVEPDEISRIFEKRYRGRHAQGVVAGDGLGLYLTKFLCDYHDVSISVDSRNPVNVGATPATRYGDFSVSLFVRRASP